MMKEKIFKILLVVCALTFALGGMAVYKKNMHIWLPHYVQQKFSRHFQKAAEQKPKHIIFALVDHFEPFIGNVSEDVAKQKMTQWSREYPKLAKKHRDANGRSPQHTWFYPQDMIHDDLYFLKELVKLSEAGFGEIEMHLHHADDTSETFRQKIDFWKRSVGAAEGSGSRKHFAYVAGNWALDNSRLENGRNFSGVNNEIEVLSDEGCYADFTFPSLGFTSQPSIVNIIFYAEDDPNRPKSYDTGAEVEVGKKQSGDLMIVQGPMEIRWYKSLKRLKPSIDDGNICETFLPFKERIDTWISSHIHVKGQPNWIFVKVHTHGCEDAIMPVVLGKPRDDMHTYLEQKYNDGENYLLHYVTAREMYNIIKAAESGKTGNPYNYRNFLISPYVR